MDEKKKTRGGKREGAGRKATGIKKPERLTLRITAEEKARVVSDAEKAGMTVADFVLFRLYGNAE